MFKRILVMVASIVSIYAACVLITAINKSAPTVPPAYTEVTTTEWSGGTTHVIYFSSSIEAPEYYSTLLLQLTQAAVGDKFIFHLAGNGGDAATILAFYNAINSTVADTVAVVDGPVYSAHAYLSVLTKQTIVNSGTIFMFHRGSIFGQEQVVCKEYKGRLDRKQDAYKKCLDFIESWTVMENRLLPQMLGKYLTTNELQRILEGHDVYVQGDEMKRRVGETHDSNSA